MEGSANYVEKKNQEHIVLLAHKGESEEKNNWYLNTIASNHMCGFKSILVELDALESSNVMFGDA